MLAHDQKVFVNEEQPGCSIVSVTAETTCTPDAFDREFNSKHHCEVIYKH